jgi:catechol 2,3-dioxygenase-like lactoylglutathione lyase family enzyme
MRLAAARIFVRDLESAQRFYAGTLGLGVRAGGPDVGWLVLDVGEVDLVLEPVALDDDADDQQLVGRFTGLSLRVDDIAATWARLRDAGAILGSEPRVQPWGGTLGTVVDPDGNRLDLVEYPRTA